MSDLVLIIDFGSQYTHLIERNLRELRIDAKVIPSYLPISEVLDCDPKGIILSGGPNSVYGIDAPRIDKTLLYGDIPILGICYGMQLITHLLGGEVERGEKREYGPSMLFIDRKDPLFLGISSPQRVWMSHSDLVTRLPEGFVSLAHTKETPFAAIKHRDRPIYGVQFHPEVSHTPCGKDLLDNFVHLIAKCESNITIEDFLDRKVKEIKEKVGEDTVIGALSGGVDSTVAASIVHRAIGKNLRLVFVDTGLMRIGDREKIAYLKDVLGLNIDIIDAEKDFLDALKGITDPEEKRKIIGHKFIEVFEDFAKRHKDARWLLQGTIYPDVVESAKVNTSNPQLIKSHHNVGGLPPDMHLNLLEPIRELFKDEVREVGKALKIPDDILMAHPFPGPGLAIRILGEVSKEKLDILRKVDKIYIEELKKHGEYERVWQAFSVLLPLKSVGVVGDERAYKFVVALRAVVSRDGMTADWARIPYDLLEEISLRITNEVKEVGRVVYDITPKPPGTIEWE